MKLNGKAKLGLAVLFIAACVFGGYKDDTVQQAAKQTTSIETADVARIDPNLIYTRRRGFQSQTVIKVNIRHYRNGKVSTLRG